MKEIIIIDLGYKYNERLSEEIRSIGVGTKIVDHTVKAEELRSGESEIIGFILSGDGQSDHLIVDPNLYRFNVPILSSQYQDDFSWPEDELRRLEFLKAFVLEDCAFAKEV